VNTPTPTLFESKSVSFGVPTSHSAQSNVKLAIRPKKIINNMLGLIPEMKENKRYVNCLWPFLPSTQWTQWSTVMLHRLFSNRFDWIKTDVNYYALFQSVKFSFLLPVKHFMFKSLGEQNVSSKFTDTILYYIHTKFP